MDNTSYQSDSSGFTAGLLVGLIIGGAGGYLLSTEKGQELLESLKENAGEKFKEIVENPALAERLADLESTMQEAKKALQSSKGDALEKVHAVAEKVALETAPEPKKHNFFSRSGSRLGK